MSHHPYRPSRDDALEQHVGALEHRLAALEAREATRRAEFRSAALTVLTVTAFALLSAVVGWLVDLVC